MKKLDKTQTKEAIRASKIVGWSFVLWQTLLVILNELVFKLPILAILLPLFTFAVLVLCTKLWRVLFG